MLTTCRDTEAPERMPERAYRPTRGAPCPACPGVAPTYASRHVGPVRVRYHECSACGARFKTTDATGEAAP